MIACCAYLVPGSIYEILTRIFYKFRQWQYLYSPSLPMSMNKFIMELLNVCKFLVIDFQENLKSFSVIN
jgi:hypothetical protein